MARTDQILKTTAAMQDKLLNQGYTNHYAEAFADGFHEGAAWADANICWHKYPEDRPDEDYYLIYCIDHTIYFDYFFPAQDDEDVDSWENTECDQVLAWTELPQPPKFD